ncbi:MAG TPA: glutamine-hydrolyzing GMP synthase, partial [Bryobacteraceae bacterium]|nr:glutamine-hydrolyzing GMP synthase [Bryobacteraceae bacterium]
YGVQFHPEVVHTANGRQILTNFLFDICGCAPDWDPRGSLQAVEDHIREVVGDRNVFFFVSGGVDSTVAFTLCLRALGDDRVSGYYVDTGLMREDETDHVREMFVSLGSRNFSIEDAHSQFLSALDGIADPEKKRHVIGQEFVSVQERILRTGHFLEGNWILGQGTIYPDTIESGGTAKADLIKTHHNRVAGIQKLIEEKRIVEPLSFFYKDEVRAIGKELGLPEAFLNRHPFPGPGLAIRCLCAEQDAEPRRIQDGWIIPVRSVGVQGDERSYRPVLAIRGEDLHARATELVNRHAEINRVIAEVQLEEPIEQMRVRPAMLSRARLDLLRKADAIVRRICIGTGFEEQVWQFPVVLIPFGSSTGPDSVVLRPVDSVDGMTAASVAIPPAVLQSIALEILSLPGIGGVFHDLTHKPPGTIEWE